VTVKVTAVPGAAHWVSDGDADTVGAALTQETVPKATVTPAFVLLVQAGVILTPATES
jgi:hypothetical protein